MNSALISGEENCMKEKNKQNLLVLMIIAFGICFTATSGILFLNRYSSIEVDSDIIIYHDSEFTIYARSSNGNFNSTNYSFSKMKVESNPITKNITIITDKHRLICHKDVVIVNNRNALD